MHWHRKPRNTRGKALGNKEYTDTDGAFTASFSENEEAYTGYPCIDARVCPTPVSYKKAEWEVVLKKGDGVAGLHIPRGADLSPEVMKSSFKLVLDVTNERYPEFSAIALHCSTWMLDPRLEELLGENSRLVGFMKSFEKYPKRCPGNAVFTFVFDGMPERLEELPEDTSLRRKIKSIYLNGGAINVHGGIIYP